MYKYTAPEAVGMARYSWAETPFLEEHELVFAMDAIGTASRVIRGMWYDRQWDDAPATAWKVLDSYSEYADRYFQKWCSWMDEHGRLNSPMIVQRRKRRA